MNIFCFRKTVTLGGLFCFSLVIANIVLSQELPPSESELELPAPTELAIEPAELTLDRVIEIALSNHPALQEKSALVERARGMRWDATRPLNPTFGYQGSELGDDGTLGLQGFFYSQEYVTANKLGLSNQVGGWEVETANWNWQVQKLKVAGDARQRFYAVLAAKRRIEILKVMDDVLLDGVNLTQKLVDTGEIGKGQMLQAQLQRKQNLLELRNAEQRLVSTGQALGVVLGIDFVDVDAVVGALDSVVPGYDFEEKFQSIAQSHPIIETARAEMLRHQWAVQRERAEPTPNVQSQVGLQFNNATDEVVVNLQFGLELPIHNQNSGRIAAATADYIRTSHKVKRLELALRQRYVTAFRDYTIAQQTLSQLENELLPLSQESLQSTQTLYKAGLVSYVGLLQAQKAYVDILLSLNDAKREAWQAVALINSGLMNGGLSLQN